MNLIFCARVLMSVYKLGSQVFLELQPKINSQSVRDRPFYYRIHFSSRCTIQLRILRSSKGGE